MMDISQDHRVFDNRECLVFSQAGSLQRDHIPDCLRREIRLKEGSRSMGAVRQGDTQWELPRVSTHFSPGPGDRLIDSQETEWTILAVDLVSQGTRYRCWCRNLSLAENLKQSIVIQEATWQQDDLGVRVATWEDRWTQVAARVQPLQSEKYLLEDVEMWKQPFEITLHRALPVTSQHRIMYEDQLFSIRQVEWTEELEHLQKLYVSKFDTYSNQEES
ncbi:Hypothetical protein PBC10988_27620 [Planctomycetales bacterium 10988]|nr:Hypothetical protein PBC10988_27620 [Planctomycetales bacterium 10988]